MNTFLPFTHRAKDKKVITVSTGIDDHDFVNPVSLAIAAPYSIFKPGTNALVAKRDAVLGKKEVYLFH